MRFPRFALPILALLLALASPGRAADMRLTSPDFSEAGAIPAEFTCEGKNVSPRLEIKGAPAGRNRWC